MSRPPRERRAGRESFTGVGKYRFSHRSELAMVAEGVLVRDAPQLASDELSVACEEAHRARRLILIERLAIRVARAAGNVVKLQVRESGYMNDASNLLQPGSGQRILVRQIHAQGGDSIARPQIAGRIEWVRFAEVFRV